MLSFVSIITLSSVLGCVEDLEVRRQFPVSSRLSCLDGEPFLMLNQPPWLNVRVSYEGLSKLRFHDLTCFKHQYNYWSTLYLKSVAEK